jgi:hypothetical protein
MPKIINPETICILFHRLFDQGRESEVRRPKSGDEIRSPGYHERNLHL